MAHYFIASVKITDDSWVPDYAAKVHEIAAKHGGEYLARSGNITNLEGAPLDTTLIAIIRFPSLDAAKAFASDPEYAPFAEARRGGSVSQIDVIDDTDLAGAIPYLGKG
jgi:uncharacterized protein (DUF1330 family)